MKKSLRPENRALFDAGRRGLSPTGDDRARVATALGLKVGVGAGIAASTAKAAAGSATSTAVAGLSSGGIVAAKWIAVVAVAAGIGTGGVALYRRDPPRAPPPLTAHSAAAPAPGPSLQERTPGAARRELPRVSASSSPGPLGVAPPDSSAGNGGAAAAPTARAAGTVMALKPSSAAAAASRASISPAAVATQAGSALPAPGLPSSAPVQAGPVASAPVPAPSAAASSARVGEETRLLREADAALRAGDTAGATRLLDDHARLFPRGVLAEERDVQRVLVLCAAGEVGAARAEAGRFLSAYPQSLLAGRVRASCAAP